MICTSVLLFFYLHGVRKMRVFPWAFVIFFVALEGFFVSSLTKFFHGGYFTILMAALIMGVMVSWYNGSRVERRQYTMLPVRKYLDQLDRLREDPHYEMLCDNLVYLTNSTSTDMLDRDILCDSSSTSTPSAPAPTGSSTSRSPMSRTPSSTPSKITAPTSCTACTCILATRSTSA